MTGFNKQPDELPEDEVQQELQTDLAASEAEEPDAAREGEDGGAPKPEKKESLARQIWLFFRPAVICCAVILLVNQLFILYAIVPTGSMEPLLQPGSLIFANRRAYDRSSPQRGDVIVFETDQSSSSLLVKRVVAIEGDVVELRDGSVFLNGVEQDESAYAIGKTFPNVSGDTFVVPEGCVLVFGDNREDSADARYWNQPYLPVDQVKGRVFFTFSIKGWYARTVPHGAKRVTSYSGVLQGKGWPAG